MLLGHAQFSKEQRVLLVPKGQLCFIKLISPYMPLVSVQIYNRHKLNNHGLPALEADPYLCLPLLTMGLDSAQKHLYGRFWNSESRVCVCKIKSSSKKTSQAKPLSTARIRISLEVTLHPGRA